MSWIGVLLGRRLANREQKRRRIGVWTGLPALGLDGLGSASYGPEAALTILMPFGAAGLGWIGPLTLLLLVLLTLLYVSYRQTITAYPEGGGAYTVAKENLGTKASLLAAAALMIDYVLNVAVGISAGVAALVSALPGLHPYTLHLCLLVLAVITLVNLRGTMESGIAFALPTYLFLASFLGILGIGIVRSLLAAGHPQPVSPPPPLAAGAAGPVGAWLLMRAFASGCTAMTGVEAVSNGITAFREPRVQKARGTLTAIVVSLGVLLGGIAYLLKAFGIGAMNQSEPDYQSVLSQLTAAVVGRGAFYYLAIGSLLSVLALSANTSFVDFPRLCRLIARDGFLPSAFANVGRRLVFSVGIVFLTTSAGLLLVAFGGITERLIGLFATGAFLAFTLSQAGMVMHWWRRRQEGERALWRRLISNGLGAALTGTALLVIVAAKLSEGAWITLLAIPLLILLFQAVRRYYDRVARELEEALPLQVTAGEPPLVVLPTEDWNRLTRKALRFAMMLSPEVVAVHLSALEGNEAEEETRSLARQWEIDVEQPARQAGVPAPRLVCFQSPYRQLVDPLLQLLANVTREQPDRTIAVIVPELIKSRWWQHVLHNRRARRLRLALLQHGGERVIVIGVPWHLESAGAGG